jgi:hypothetical protein
MLTQDDFVKMLSTGKKLAASTIKNRVSYLFKQYRHIGGNANDLSYLNSYSKVIRHINESSKSDEGRKTYIFHVISLIGTKAGKIVSDDASRRLSVLGRNPRSSLSRMWPRTSNSSTTSASMD